MHSLSLLKSSVLPKFKTSYLTLVGTPEPTQVALNDRTEVIRTLMLNELGEYAQKKFPAVIRRVRHAPDALGLWYARSDVMGILANSYGETVARKKIADISSRFGGLLPASLTRKAGFRIR